MEDDLLIEALSDKRFDILEGVCITQFKNNMSNIKNEIKNKQKEHLNELIAQEDKYKAAEKDLNQMLKLYSKQLKEFPKPIKMIDRDLRDIHNTHLLLDTLDMCELFAKYKKQYLDIMANVKSGQILNDMNLYKNVVSIASVFSTTASRQINLVGNQAIVKQSDRIYDDIMHTFDPYSGDESEILKWNLLKKLNPEKAYQYIVDKINENVSRYTIKNSKSKKEPVYDVLKNIVIEKSNINTSEESIAYIISHFHQILDDIDKLIPFKQTSNVWENCVKKIVIDNIKSHVIQLLSEISILNIINSANFWAAKYAHSVIIFRLLYDFYFPQWNCKPFLKISLNNVSKILKECLSNCFDSNTLPIYVGATARAINPQWGQSDYNNMTWFAYLNDIMSKNLMDDESVAFVAYEAAKPALFCFGNVAQSVRNAARSAIRGDFAEAFPDLAAVERVVGDVRSSPRYTALCFDLRSRAAADLLRESARRFSSKHPEIPLAMAKEEAQQLVNVLAAKLRTREPIII